MKPTASSARARHPDGVFRAPALALAAGLALLAVGLAYPDPASAAPAAGADGAAIPRTYFGMHIHDATHLRDADGRLTWPGVGFGSLRLWDASVDWSSLEPFKGGWKLRHLDDLVDLAQAQNVEIVLTLGTTPRWASARPDEAAIYGKGSGAEPRDIDDWRTYVRMIATRYKGRIGYYEMWNEPHFGPGGGTGFFTGTAPAMVALAKVAFEEIRAADPAARLLSPGVVSEVSRIEPYFAAGGGKYTDIVAAHFYGGPPANRARPLP